MTSQYFKRISERERERTDVTSFLDEPLSMFFIRRSSNQHRRSILSPAVLWRHWWMTKATRERQFDGTLKWIFCLLLIIVHFTMCIRDSHKLTWFCWFGFRLKPISGNNRPAQETVAHIQSSEKWNQTNHCATFTKVQYKSLKHSLFALRLIGTRCFHVCLLHWIF